MKICSKNPNLVEIGRKYRTLHTTTITFSCCRRHQIAVQAISLREIVSGCLESHGGKTTLNQPIREAYKISKVKGKGTP
jgi:hypothetical protein